MKLDHYPWIPSSERQFRSLSRAERLMLVNKLFTESVSPFFLSINGIVDRKVQFRNSVEGLVTDLQMFKTSQQCYNIFCWK